MQATTIAEPVRSTGQALRTSLAGALDTVLRILPQLLGFAVVLVVGWVLSSLLARGVAVVLQAVRFDDLARRSGFAGFVQKMGVRQEPAGVIGGVVKWFVRLITLVVAFDLLGLPAVSVVLQQLLLWLPNLIVALVVLVIGGLAADALSQVIRGTTAEAGFDNPDVLAAVTKVSVWAFAIVVAVNQLGIATTLINTLLVGVVGAVAPASGLAFGLGGRDRAAQILDQLGRKTGRGGPRLERPVSTASGEVGRPSVRAVAEASVAPDFEEDWIPRSGSDRRRVARPTPDRRIAGGLVR
jgi:hypothetical protein